MSKTKNTGKGKATYKNQALLDHISPTALNFEPNKLFMTDKFAAVLAIDLYPSSIQAGFLAKIAKLDDVQVSVHAKPLKSQEFLNLIDDSIKNRQSQVGDEDIKASQVHSISRKDQVSAELFELIHAKNEIVSSCVILIRVEADDQKELKDKIDYVNSELISAGGLRASTLSYLQEEGQRGILPYNLLNAEISRYKEQLFPASTMSALFVYDNSQLKDDAGLIMGRDQDSNIVIFDMWARDTAMGRRNSNIVVIGASGTGKSATVKKLLIAEAGRGTQIIAIDPENEYKDLSTALSGSYLDLVGGNSFINPLQINISSIEPDEDEGPIDNFEEHIRYLKNFFSLYLKGLDFGEIAYLSEITLELYESFGITKDTNIDLINNNQYPLMKDLYELILEKQKQSKEAFMARSAPEYELERIEKIRVLLHSAVKGEDAKLFNNYTNIDMNNDFLCLNVNKLMQAPENLKKAQYFSIMNFCWSKITDKSRNSILVCDEAHTMLDKDVPDTAKTLQQFSKRIRKQNGALIIITQELQDFLHPSVSEYGVGMLSNASIKFLGGADGQALETAVNVYNLNNSEKSILEKGERGKMLLMVGFKKIVVRVNIAQWEFDLMGDGGGR